MGEPVKPWTIEDYATHVQRLQHRVTACERRSGALVDALRSLANEASGFIALADMETHGVTNVRVLQQRIDEAREVLQRTEQAA